MASTLGADIWHWNTSTSTTIMTQTITDVQVMLEKTRDVVLTSCGRINCGSYDTYTDVYVQLYFFLERLSNCS